MQIATGYCVFVNDTILTTSSLGKSHVLVPNQHCAAPDELRQHPLTKTSTHTRHGRIEQKKREAQQQNLQQFDDAVASKHCSKWQNCMLRSTIGVTSMITRTTSKQRPFVTLSRQIRQHGQHVWIRLRAQNRLRTTLIRFVVSQPTKFSKLPDEAEFVFIGCFHYCNIEFRNESSDDDDKQRV